MRSISNILGIDVIERLKDDEEYYNGIGQNYLSASILKHYYNNILPYRRKEGFIHPLSFGDAVHKSVLEPLKYEELYFAPIGTPNALTMADKAHSDFLRDCLTAHPEVNAILEDGNNQFEVPFIGEFDGVPLKCKCDIIGDTMNYDIKTTGNLEAYDYTAPNLWHYDISAYQYFLLTGRLMTFIVVEKNTGKIRIVTPTERFYNEGRRKWWYAIKNYKKSMMKSWTYLGHHSIKSNLFDMDGVSFKTENGKLYGFITKEEYQGV